MFMPFRAKLRQNNENVVSQYLRFSLQLPVITLSIKEVQYYCSIWLKDSPIITFQNVTTRIEENLKGEKSSELRLNGDIWEKMEASYFWLLLESALTPEVSGTAQVLNIIVKNS